MLTFCFFFPPPQYTLSLSSTISLCFWMDITWFVYAAVWSTWPTRHSQKVPHQLECVTLHISVDDDAAVVSPCWDFNVSRHEKVFYFNTELKSPRFSFYFRMLLRRRTAAEPSQLWLPGSRTMMTRAWTSKSGHPAFRWVPADVLNTQVFGSILNWIRYPAKNTDNYGRNQRVSLFLNFLDDQTMLQDSFKYTWFELWDSVNSTV